MNIRLASAPVSWGIFEFAGIEPRFPYSQVLDEIAGTGYLGTELGPYGYLPTDGAKLRPELESRNLQLLSAFVPVALKHQEAHAQGLQTALQVGRLLKDLGATMLVLADDNGSQPDLVAEAGRRTGCRLNAAEWKVFGQGVEEIRRALRDELGLRLVFHHHCAGYVETPAETRALLENSEVDLCLDTGHWHYAGGDAVQCLQEFGKRVSYLHFKDYAAAVGERCRQNQEDYFAAVKAGVFCPLGQGEVDFPGILRELARQEYDGWAVVEQDILTDDLAEPRRCSQQNRDYLKGLGL